MYTDFQISPAYSDYNYIYRASYSADKNVQQGKRAVYAVSFNLYSLE
jgi:hypothetical protein